MSPKVILETIGSLLTAVSKLISAQDERSAQLSALYEAEEAIKKALDHAKFGEDRPSRAPTNPNL